jgi:hypothetical protein
MLFDKAPKEGNNPFSHYIVGEQKKDPSEEARVN